MKRKRKLNDEMSLFLIKTKGGEVGTKLNLSSLCTQVSRNGQREVCANDVVFCWRMVGMMHQERGFHSNPIINY